MEIMGSDLVVVVTNKIGGMYDILHASRPGRLSFVAIGRSFGAVCICITNSVLWQEGHHKIDMACSPQLVLTEILLNYWVSTFSAPRPVLRPSLASYPQRHSYLSSVSHVRKR